MQYNLNINFKKEDLAALYEAGENITIFKQVKTNGIGSKNVAWVSFKPFMSNTVTWEENYALYCSNKVELDDGTVINKMSHENDVVDQKCYPFEKAIFQKRTEPPPEKPLTGGQFMVLNKDSAYNSLTFGMAQDVIVNNTNYKVNTLNAAVIPYNQYGIFTPLEKISVVMLANTQNDMVISQVGSKTLDITYSGSDIEKNIVYDQKKGMFVYA
ncbi:MAG: hypothetical protein N3I35_03105 [Clostridia bacterium]|nr:hypothetical protein [Clostridia bacterium]